jgi:phage FluMu gp28-like protein
MERLRAQVEAATAAAIADPVWSLSLEEKEKLVATHELGTNHSGWINPYPKDDPRSLLLEPQFALYHDRSRFKCTVMHRQGGKDFTHAGETVEDCHQRTTQWMIAAPSERQSLDSLEQDKIWAEAFNLYIDDYRETREGSSSESLLKSAEVKFHNGSKIIAVPGRPDTVRGKSCNVRITEFDFLEDPSATWRALLPSITNPLRGGEKKCRVYSTPNGIGSAMHRIMTKADTEKMRWSRRTITIFDSILMGLPVDFAQIREAMDDAEGIEQEYLCRFLDQSSVLLPYELIGACESTEATTVVPTSFWDVAQTSPLFMGLDFGRKHNLSVPWTLQRVGDVLHTREVEEFRNMSTPDQFAALEHKIERCARVCVDYTGPGVGLGDLLVKRFGEYKPTEDKFGKIELCTFTPSLKLDLFPTLKVAFEQRRLRVPVSRTIREDLHSVHRVTTASGNITYRAPNTADGHADRCTGLALAVRAAGTGGGPFTYQRIERGRSDDSGRHDHDDFAQRGHRSGRIFV